ncbi:MAG: hypothetical protein H7Z75_09605 [Ferruginibacter sp.]|nr:hypothetical protein [Cytophagales bacterium]
MDKLKLKKRILEESKRIQRELVKRLESVSRRQAQAEEEGAANLTALSREPEPEPQNRLFPRLADALEGLATLEKLAVEALHERVAPGSVVLTDVRNFFVAVSLAEFSVEGQTYLGLSPESPAYPERAHKRQGDTFRLGGAVHRIEDVF